MSLLYTTGRFVFHILCEEQKIGAVFVNKILVYFLCFIRHCFISRPLDSTVLEDAGIEPNHSVRCPPFCKVLQLKRLIFLLTRQKCFQTVPRNPPGAPIGSGVSK
jgi:hypothetical protein